LKKAFYLNAAELDAALNAISFHGYSDFFPNPPEFTVLKEKWPLFRDHLATLNLEEYKPYRPMEMAAPKSKINLRWVSLLHPFDIVIYTALVLLLREEIEEARVAADQGIILSFRRVRAGDRLYDVLPSHSEFSERLLAKAKSNSTGYVALTDIADFYPRLYQHRVRNALDALLSGRRKAKAAQLLEEKLLRGFASDGASLGIPIGPPASRPLAEAALIDVDESLLSFKIDFIRYIDDFAIFGDSVDAVEWGVRQLGETLYKNHGLTLQSAKTAICSCTEYVQEHQYDETEEDEVERAFDEIVEQYFYDAFSLDELTSQQREAIDSMDFAEVLTSALQEEKVNYKKVAFILEKLSAVQHPDLIPIILDNLPRLYPVAHAIHGFFSDFEFSNEGEQRDVGEKLLEPILSTSGMRALEYYSVWILQLFAEHSSWNHSRTLLRIFREGDSEAVRRYAALAIGKSGSRSSALLFKQYLGAASELIRTAMLLSSSKLGRDERRHWIAGLRLKDFFERNLL
jgi:hypothetical protein